MEAYITDYGISCPYASYRWRFTDTLEYDWLKMMSLDGAVANFYRARTLLVYSIKGEAQHECVRFGKEFGLDFGLGFD